MGSFVFYCIIPTAILFLLVYSAFRGGIWFANHRITVTRREQPVRLASSQAPAQKQKPDPVGYGSRPNIQS